MIRPRLVLLAAALLTCTVAAGPASAAPRPGRPVVSTGPVPTAPGRYARTLQHANLQRRYLLAIPAGYDASRPAPLLFVFHGAGQSAGSFARRHPALLREADAAGVILVLPQGTPNAVGKNRWTLPEHDAAGVDDPGLVRALLEELGGALTVDAARVYAAGFSNGGTFTHHLAATYPQTFAAAVICGSRVGSRQGVARPQAPVPTLLVFGELDTVRLLDGGATQRGERYMSVDALAELWARANGCSATPQVRQRPGKTVRRYSPPQGGAEVALVVLARMDHAWPDAADGWGFDANAAALRFCLRHRQ